MIIGITGKMGSGKDECFKQLKAKGVDVIQCSFATALKQMVNKAWKIPEADALAKPKYVRDLYQIVGTELFRRQISDSFWVDTLSGDINEKAFDRVSSHEKHIIITDVRFLNEANFIKKRKGYLIKVIRPEGNTVAETATVGQSAHASETELDKIIPDIEVLNNGTIGELGEKVFYCLEVFLGQKVTRI